MGKKIMFDKGHGGSDPGAVANGLQEKVLVSKIVDYAEAYLKANYTGFEYKETRIADQTLSLTERTNMANAWGADVFVSVHINAGGGKGFESFIYNGTTSAATQAFQNALHAEIFAAMIKEGVTTDRGKKRANFAVLRQTKMIAVLTENLFIDTSDANYLKKEAFLKAVGEAHARGVAKYLGLPSKPQSKPSAPVKKPSNEIYTVQVFAGSKAGADRVAEQARKAGFKDAYVKLKD